MSRRLAASLVALSALFSLRAETLGVYLDKPLPALAAASFQEELGKLSKTLGVSVDLRALKDRKGESFDHLMVVQVRGTCDIEESHFRTPGGPLASTQVQGDRILPYAELFCDRTRETLLPALAKEPAYRRGVLLGRALARVLAHELYHFLSQDKEHASSGVAKACFNRRDLLNDEFGFDEHTLARVRVGQGAPGGLEGTTADTGNASDR